MSARLKAEANASTKGPQPSGAYVNKLKNPVVRDAWMAYLDNAYSGMNRHLRGDTSLPITPKDKARAELMRDKFDQMAEPYPGTVLYRGAYGDVGSKLAVGDTFKDDGFISMTSLAGLAADFMTHGSGDQTLFKVKTPRGTKVVPGNDWEHEWIMKPGTTFNVVSVEEGPPVAGSATRIITLELP